MLERIFVPVSEENKEKELDKAFEKSRHEAQTEYGHKMIDFLTMTFRNREMLPGFENVGDYVIKDFLNSRSKQLYNHIVDILNRVMVVNLGINDESFVRNALRTEFEFANLDFIKDLIKKSKEVKSEHIYYLVNSLSFGFAMNILYDISVYNASVQKMDSVELFKILDDITPFLADSITDFIYDAFVYTLCYHESLGILL